MSREFKIETESEKLSNASTPPALNGEAPEGKDQSSFLGWIKNFIGQGAEPTLRETIDEFINEPEQKAGDPGERHERLLLANILKLRHMAVSSVMIPRANIVALEISATQDELLALLAEKQFSRIPVYRGTLDDVLGTIHLKDVLAAVAKGETLNLRSLIKETPVVSPAMPVIDLLLTMRESRRHMALVVDEYGGIDGLVTVNDVLETIVGELEDEHDVEENQKIISKSDGSILVDARLTIKDFEDAYGEIFTNEERANADTLSGLVFATAGRIPARGEIITHHSGMIFEIMDADPRRIHLLKIRNIPKPQPPEEET